MAYRRDPGGEHDRQQFLDLTQVVQEIVDAPQTQYEYEAPQPEPYHVPRPSPPPSSVASSYAGRYGAKPAKPVPHYLAETIVKKDRLFRWLFGLSLAINLIYFGLRIVYIVSGRVEVLTTGGDEDEDEGNVELQNRTALVYSIIVLVAELGGFVLVHAGQQMFWRQKTLWAIMDDANVARIREIVRERGALQSIHVIVCTYSEEAATVEACVRHLLAAPLPVYAERTVWIADDGHAKPCGKDKAAFVARMRAEGHNVKYIGDRVRRTGQLNGKSSNLNHVILNKIYPDVQHSNQVSWRDILVVMDCDHLVKPAFFQKCCACLLDKDVAVVLVPQAFHNAIRPDCFDNTNTNFMFRLMPFYFGAGCCFITGTNVMIRARACFLACKFGEDDAVAHTMLLNRAPEAVNVASASRHRQLFSEVLVAEDVDLGSRIHALGYKSRFLDEVLARGEVPQAPRDFWKQRSRWAKASHLYILDRHSVFWRRQPFMSRYQKSLYCIPLVLHFTIFFTEPVMYTLPTLCICFTICPYGIDIWLWITHFFRLTITFLISTHADSLVKRWAALASQTSSRVLYFVNVKAVLNTLMIGLRWKKPGAFKVTAKAPAAGGSAAAAPPKAVAEAMEPWSVREGPGWRHAPRALGESAAPRGSFRSSAPTGLVLALPPSLSRGGSAQQAPAYRAPPTPSTTHATVTPFGSRGGSAVSDGSWSGSDSFCPPPEPDVMRPLSTGGPGAALAQPEARPADPKYSPRQRELSLELAKSTEFAAARGASALQLAARVVERGGTPSGMSGCAEDFEAAGAGADEGGTVSHAAALAVPRCCGRWGSQELPEFSPQAHLRGRDSPLRCAEPYGEADTVAPAAEWIGEADVPLGEDAHLLLSGNDRRPGAVPRRAAAVGEGHGGGRYPPVAAAPPGYRAPGIARGSWEHPQGAPYMAEHILPAHERNNRASSAGAGLGIGSRLPGGSSAGKSSRASEAGACDVYVPGGPPGYDEGHSRDAYAAVAAVTAQAREEAVPVEQGCGLYQVHDKLSEVTEKRKACMPFEGTFDFWVLLVITLMNVFAMCWGLSDLASRGKIISLRGSEEDNIRMIAVVFALVEATPGLLYIWYMVSYQCCRWTLWLWVPLVIGSVSLLVMFIEARVGLQYVSTALGLNWQLPDCDLDDCDIFSANKN